MLWRSERVGGVGCLPVLYCTVPIDTERTQQKVKTGIGIDIGDTGLRPVQYVFTVVHVSDVDNTTPQSAYDAVWLESEFNSAQFCKQPLQTRRACASRR